MELHTGLIEINLTSLMILINIFILYIILKKYFWEKVKAFMDDRSNAIKDAIDGAEAMNKRADAKMANYSKRIANIEEEGRVIIKEARQQADRHSRSSQKRESKLHRSSRRQSAPLNWNVQRQWMTCVRKLPASVSW